MEWETEPIMLTQHLHPFPRPPPRRRPQCPSRSSLPSALRPLQQWPRQLSSPVTHVNKLMSILLARKASTASAALGDSTQIPAAPSEARGNLFSWFWEREMSSKPPALLLPPTLQLTFFAHLLPQVIVLNSGMTSWTVRPYFFIALCFLCTLSTAQNAGGTCCVHTLGVFSVLFFSHSLK